MLSDSGAATLSFLGMLPNNVACENCIGAHLGVDRFGALKYIRELVGAGHILCRYTQCEICHERRLVAQVRGKRPG